jgi:hypothetical protein
MSVFGNKLNPYRAIRKPLGVKGNRTSIAITNNPSTIGQNQLLIVRFPNLAADDVIVPGSARLAFSIELTSTDKNRTIVNNLGRAIVKKISIKLDGNEVSCIDDADVYYCYKDLWLTNKERTNGAYRGIQDANLAAIRIKAENATDKQPDSAIAEHFGNRFYIPLDFELLTDHMPYYQSGLDAKLTFEFTFNDYGQVIKSSNENASYTISGISLEFDIVSHPELARLIQLQYQQQFIVLYSRVLRQRKVMYNKSDAVWNVNINTPCRSLTGILLLFVDEDAGKNFNRNPEAFYNPKISKVSIIVEGKPNQLYANGLLPYQMWDEVAKFAGNELSSLDHKLYFNSQYALWLDFRTNEDHSVHGSGRRVENASEGLTIEIHKKVESSGVLNCYVYLVMDAQLNISGGRFISAIY